MIGIFNVTFLSVRPAAISSARRVTSSIAASSGDCPPLLAFNSALAAATRAVAGASESFMISVKISTGSRTVGRSLPWFFAIIVPSWKFSARAQNLRMRPY